MSALFVALACWCWPDSPAVTKRRSRGRWESGARGRSGLMTAGVRPSVLGSVVGVASGWVWGVPVGLAFALLTWTMFGLIRAERTVRRSRGELAELLVGVRALARELRSGSPPEAAISSVGRAHPGAGQLLMAAIGTMISVDRIAAEHPPNGSPASPSVRGSPGPDLGAPALSVNPLDPVSPVSPVGSLGSLGLVGSVGPVGSVGSVGSVGRAGPVGRVGSVGSVGAVSSVSAVRAVGSVSSVSSVSVVADRLAAGWALSVRHGVPWAALIDALATDLAEQVRTAAARDVQVAGPRFSGYVLAGMPGLGILLGVGMGAHPVHVLLDTGAGGVMLVAGVTLTCVGLQWSARIVRG